MTLEKALLAVRSRKGYGVKRPRWQRFLMPAHYSALDEIWPDGGVSTWRAAPGDREARDWVVVP